MSTLHFRFAAGILLVALAIATRLLPHAPNFTAISAVALVAGCYLGWRAAAGITMAAMFLSDIFLGFYSLPIMLSVYGSLLAAATLGQWVKLGGRVSGFRAIAATLSGSILFFLVTNYAVWQFTAMYPKTLAGLFSSYLAALPFFRSSMLGDLMYAGILLGVAEAVRFLRHAMSYTTSHVVELR